MPPSRPAPLGRDEPPRRRPRRCCEARWPAPRRWPGCASRRLRWRQGSGSSCARLLVRVVRVLEHRGWIDVQLQNALRDWQRAEGPLYVQLSAALRAAIEAGELPAGRKLPPERILASYLAVGRRTVARAYEVLSDRALVDRRQGAGTRVTGPLVRVGDNRAAKRTTSLQRNIVFASLGQSSTAV